MGWRKRTKNILFGVLTLGGLITSLFPGRTKKARRIIDKTAEVAEKVNETGILDEPERPDFFFCPGCNRKHYRGESNYCGNCGRVLK